MHKSLAVVLLLSMLLSACAGLLPDRSDGLQDPDAVGPAISGEESGAESESLLVVKPGEQPAPSVEPEEVDFTFPEPNPLDVTIEVDSEQSVEAEIGPRGGRLELVDEGGTRFVLEIPPDALLSPETIQMTAISRIEGFPFDTLDAAAVNLQPEGLVFFKGVTLRIIGESLSGEGDLVGFGTEGNGADFHFQPSIEEDDEIQIFILHFSNYGVTKATGEVIEHIRSRYVPSTAANYAWDQINNINNLVSDKDALFEAYKNILTQWLHASILTRIENAAIFEDRIDYAVGEYLQWNDYIDFVDYVFGAFDGQMREALTVEIELVKDALANTLFRILERNYTRCVQNRDPQAAFRMYRYGLTASALDVWGRSGLDKADMEDKIQGCFNFEFDFRSEVEGGQGDLFIVSHAVSRIPLKITNFSFSGTTVRNRGEVTFEPFTLTPVPPNCQPTSENGELEVEIRFNINYNLVKAWEISNVVLAVLNFLENPTEICVYPDFDYPFQFWALVFFSVNHPFFVNFNELHVNLIVEGEVPGIFAEAIFYGDVPGVPNGKEWTRYSLIHAPSN